MTECPCPSCTRERARQQPGYCCAACDGTGETTSIRGEPRPCSRCNPCGFHAWYQASFDNPEDPRHVSRP